VASYSAVINVSVSGQAALDKLEGSARSIQTLIQGIKQQKNIFDQAVGSEKTRELKKNLDSLVTSFAAAQDGARQFEVVVGGKTRKVNMYSKTLAGLSHQLGTFRAISDNATVGTDRFVNSLIAANKVSNELARTQARAMTAGTGVTGTPQNVQEVLALGRAIPNTIEGLTFYKGKLEELLSTLRLTSNEFRAVEEASAAVDVRLGNARLTGQTSAITPAAGPASRIDTVASYEKRAALAQKVADLEYKQLLTGQQITQSKIKEAQKTELINRLDQASKALAEGKLDVAKRLTNELRNQRIVYERGKKTSSPVELETRRNNILNSTQMLEQRALQLKTKGVNVDKQINSLQALQNRLRAQGVNLTEQDLGLIDEELNGLRNVLKLENAILGTRKAQANATKAAAAPGEQAAKNKNAMLQNALIGGAFPLLFGGGAGAVVGGFAGGFIPGNPMMSIVTSALGTMVDQFVAGVTEMGVAVKDLVGNFDKLKEANLFVSKQQEFYIQKLIESGRVQEAANAIQQRLIDIIGTQGVQDLDNAGQASTRLNKALAELGIQMQALIAGPLGVIIDRIAEAVALPAASNTATAVQQQLVKQGDKAAAGELGSRVQEIEQRPSLQLGLGAKEAAQDITKLTTAYSQLLKKTETNASISLVDREKTIKQAEQIFTELRDKERAQQELKRQNAEQYADLVRSLQRQQADLNLQYERRAQDLRISNAEKQLDLVKAIGAAQLQQLQNESRARQIEAGGGTGLAAEIATALDTYDIELKRIGQEAADAEQRAKLNIIKLDVENERFKLDNAKAIARTNLDNQIRIQRINEQINRQNAELSRRNYEQDIQQRQ
jgi:soluble cytochrome b562